MAEHKKHHHDAEVEVETHPVGFAIGVILFGALVVWAMWSHAQTLVIR
jgi:hypothetical protein